MPGDHGEADGDSADEDTAVDADSVGDEDDVEHLFTIGRRPLGELTPDELEQRRATKRFALWALAVVAVVVAVAVTLVALLVDDSSGVPTSPRATAQRWALDLVHGDTGDRRRLECDHARSADVLSLILFAPTGAHAGRAVPRGRGRWSVPVRFEQAGGSPSGTSLTVIRRGGAYLVC